MKDTIGGLLVVGVVLSLAAFLNVGHVRELATTDSRSQLALAILPTSTIPSVQVIYPNGGELLRLGDSEKYDVRAMIGTATNTKVAVFLQSVSSTQITGSLNMNRSVTAASTAWTPSNLYAGCSTASPIVPITPGWYRMYTVLYTGSVIATTTQGLNCFDSIKNTVLAEDWSDQNFQIIDKNACKNTEPGVNQFKGCFYDGMNFETPAKDAITGSLLTAPVQKTATALYRDWSTSAANTITGTDTFSARWKGTFTFSPGAYKFTAGSDDGIRVRMYKENGPGESGTVLDKWVSRGYTEDSFYHIIPNTSTRRIEIDYFENALTAKVKFGWTAVPLVTVTTPNGGETFTQGQPKAIRWASVNNGPVQVGLYKSTATSTNDVNKLIGWINPRAENTGSLDWDGLRVLDLAGSFLASVVPGSYKIGVVGPDLSGNYCLGPACANDISNFSFKVVANSTPSIIFTTSTVGSSIYPQTVNFLLSQFHATVSGGPVTLKSLLLRLSGTISPSELKNIKVYIDGQLVGPILSTWGADKTALFTFPSGVALGNGQRAIQIIGDVGSAPGTHFQIGLINASDVVAERAGSVVAITPGGWGTKVSVVTGTLTVSLASDSPAGSVSRGPARTLAKFVMYGAGEAIKIKFIDFRLAFTGPTSIPNIANEVQNIRLVDDTGFQIGSAIPMPSNAPTTACQSSSGVASLVYMNCFGTPSASVDYNIPANTTRVLALKADIPDTATFATVRGSLVGGSGNGIGMTSGVLVNLGNVTGNALSLLSNTLTVTRNPALVTSVVAKGATSVRIGSYILQASSLEGVNMTSLSITPRSSGPSLSNLRLQVGATPFGVIQPVVSGGASYTFSGNLQIPTGSSKVIDIYADILSSNSSGLFSAATSFTGCSGSGTTSFASISCPTSVPGQDLLIGGQPNIQIALDSASPPASQFVMGSTGNHLATFRLTETSNIEEIKITQLNVFQQVKSTTAVKQSFGSLALYQGSTLLGTSGSAFTSASGKGYYYQFNFATPIFVPQSGSVSVILRGDVASYNSSGATDNATHVFKIATSTDASNDTLPEAVVALGRYSNSTSTVTLVNAVANAVTVLRSKLTVTGTALGTMNHVKASTDDLGLVNFTADSAGSVVLNTVRITFGGSAPSGSAFFSASPSSSKVTLYDEATGVSYTPVDASPTSLMFRFDNYVVSAGTTKSFKLRINSLTGAGGGSTAAAAAGVSQTLSATINSLLDVTYWTAISGGSIANIPAWAVPILINSVIYSQGT